MLTDLSGQVVELRWPLNSTSFFASNIQQRVAELEKECMDVPGKVGFEEEFAVGSDRP